VVRHRPDGRPEARGKQVSSAHHGGYTLAVSGDGLLTCDLEGCEPRTAEEWRDLIGGERQGVAELLTRQMPESLDVAATRLWVAGECLRKAGRSVLEPIVIESLASDGWVVLRAGRSRITSAVVRLAGSASPLVVGLLTGPPAGEDEAMSRLAGGTASSPP
jgi:enediyne polyketide synthase